MALSKLRVILGWIFIGGHFSGFIVLFLWALFYSSKGFEAISDIVMLLLPITGVAAVTAFKAFWINDKNASKKVSKNAAIATIALPGIMSLLILCLICAYITQVASSPTAVKQGIALCELVFGGIMAFVSEKLFKEQANTHEGSEVKPDI
jgi:hypothetical protein